MMRNSSILEREEGDSVEIHSWVKSRDLFWSNGVINFNIISVTSQGKSTITLQPAGPPFTTRTIITNFRNRPIKHQSPEQLSEITSHHHQLKIRGGGLTQNSLLLKLYCASPPRGTVRPKEPSNAAASEPMDLISSIRASFIGWQHILIEQEITTSIWDHHQFYWVWASVISLHHKAVVMQIYSNHPTINQQFHDTHHIRTVAATTAMASEIAAAENKKEEGWHRTLYYASSIVPTLPRNRPSQGTTVRRRSHMIFIYHCSLINLGHHPDFCHPQIPSTAWIIPLRKTASWNRPH